MGGSGSGNRWRIGARDTCEGSNRVDLRYMRAHRMLVVGSAGTLSWSRGGERVGWIRYTVHRDTLELDYKVRSRGEEWTPINDHIQLERLPQPFGGERLYVRCKRCYRRCLVLYGGAMFRCRKCHNLAYASQNQDACDRASSKAQRIRRRLGNDGGFEDPFPRKPKGMHWATYDRLEKECALYEDQVAGKLWSLMARLGGPL